MAVLLGSATAVSVFGIGKLLFAPPEAVTRLGIFQFYMTTSELLMMSLLLTIPFVIHPRTPLRVRLAAGVALVPLSISLYATVTRGAYLAAAAGLLFIAMVRNRKLVFPLLAVVILLLLFAPPYVSSRLQSIVDLNHPENASRVLLWSTGIRIFLHYPVFGVGDIDLREMYVRFATAENPEKHGHLHNVPLQILVTLGTVGFLAFVALFVRIAQTEWRSYRRAREDWLTGSITLGALGVFVGFLVMGMTEWSFGDQEVVLLLWISVGMAIAAGHLSHTDPEMQTEPR
jgi:O-antigen ligase